MCLSCCNVIKTTKPIPPGSNLVLFTEPDEHKWGPNTKELMKAAVEHLDSQRLALTPKLFEERQQQLGMAYKDRVLVLTCFWGTLDIQ